MKISAFVVGAFCLLLAGCATPSIPYDRASAGIQTIGLVTPSIPEDASVVLASSVGQSFGLVGALVDAGLQARRDATFGEILARENYSPREAFIANLTQELRMQGYMVVNVEVARPNAMLLKTYPAAAASMVDAYLDLAVARYGYVAAGIGGSNPYRPTFLVEAKLVRTRDMAVLMQDTVSYNPTFPNPNSVTIAPNPAHQFPDFDALQMNPGPAITGLREATTETARTLSGLLR